MKHDDDVHDSQLLSGGDNPMFNLTAQIVHGVGIASKS